MSTDKIIKYTPNTLKFQKFIVQNTSHGTVRLFFFVTGKSSKTVEMYIVKQKPSLIIALYIHQVILQKMASQT